MGSDYLQPYEIAFQGSAPPLYPSSTLNDEFTNQQPPFDPAQPQGYVALDTKWITWDPFPGGPVIQFAGVDQARQMARLVALGDRNWCGKYQLLPVPNPGETLQYQLYTRSLVGFISAQVGDFIDQIMGLVIGADFAGNPSTSDLWSCHLNVARTGGSLQAITESTAWLQYNSNNAPIAQLQGLAYPWMRARIRSANAAGVFDTDLHFDVSADGIAWLGLASYLGITQALRNVCMGVRPGGDLNIASYTDFIRYYAVAATATSAGSGALQYLGAV